MKRFPVWAAVALLLAFLGGCGIADYMAAMDELDSRATTELAQLRAEVERYPDASLILHGLRAGARSSDTAYHQYKLVWRDPEAAADSLRVRVRFTDWAPISPTRFRSEEPLQGLAVWTRRAGEVDSVPTPPVHAYVGDERFGSWEGDEWVVAAQYMLLAEALDEVGDLAERRHRGKRSRNKVVVLHRGDYDAYRADPAAYRGSYRARYAAEAQARPAAAGSFDAKVRARANREAAADKPSFVERARARQAESNGRFDDKVKARMNGGSASSTPASAGAAASRRSTASSSSRPASSAGSYTTRPKATSSSGSSWSSKSSGSSSSSRRSSGSRRRN